MKWLVIFLTLSGCAASHECLQEHPEPVSGASTGAMTGGASGGVLSGVLGGLIGAAIDNANPEHQKWEKEYTECLNQKKAAK